MLRSNCLEKTVNVTARIIKALFDGCRDKITEPLNVDDITVARKMQFIVSMGPTVQAMSKGELDPLRPIMETGIIYMRSRCDGSLLELLGVSKLPILVRNTRLARLIMT